MTTWPDEASARELAASLVQNRLAACVNLLPRMDSFYEWEGEACSGQEYLLLIKTRTDRYPALEQAIHQAHPYELPEIIAVPLTDGLPSYLHWINEQVTPR